MKPELDKSVCSPLYAGIIPLQTAYSVAKQLAPGRAAVDRRCAAELQMSRTTVETAYMVLAAEGYIISWPQSGFYVTDIGGREKRQNFRKVRSKKESGGFIILRLQMLTEKPSV